MSDTNQQSSLEQPGEELLKDAGSSVGLVQTQTVRLFQGDQRLLLASGQSLGSIDVAYETYGRLNEQRDNAILIVHALSGDAHVAGRHRPEDPKPGWWDNMIGPGKPIDTDRYFVICSNCLGGCMGTTGPGSINPQTGKPYGLTFPIITIGDMVDLQRHLIDYLGIEKLLAVVGGSMGGMEVLEWAIRFPTRIHAALPIATTARLTAQSIAFNAVGRNAILSDENFQQGTYYLSDNFPNTGLSVARMIGHITYLSEKAMHEKFGRRLQHSQNYQYNFAQEFSVESYLDHQGTSFVDRFDANTYVYFTKAMDYFDLSHQHGSLFNAIQGTKCRFLIISFTSDWLFPPRQSQELVNTIIAADKDVTYCDIDCPYGHDSFLLESHVQGQLIRGFLQQTYQRISSASKTTSSPPDPKPVAVQQKNAPPRTKKNGSIFEGFRVDHRQIAHLIPPDSSVLDLGCGDGTLLALLQEKKNIRGMGVTLSTNDVLACTRRGVSVVQYDMEKYLHSFAEKSFDYVVLSQTFQVIRQPEKALRQMLRIGRQIIVSFPNIAYWRGRLHLLWRGKAPMWKQLPGHWYDKPEESVNYLSIRDFEHFIYKQLNAFCITRIPFSSHTGRQVRFHPNFFADEVIFVITDECP